MSLLTLPWEAEVDPWDHGTFKGGDGTESWAERAAAWVLKLDEEGLNDLLQNVALTDLLLRLAERMDDLQSRYSH